MSLFSKKKNKDKDFDDDDDLIEEREDERLGKKLKDLKSSNKKKRKEPPKPWGRKERLIVLIAICLTVLAAVFLSFSSKFFILGRFANFNVSFIPFDLKKWNPFAEQTIIIKNLQ